jgi:hypothetical protein
VKYPVGTENGAESDAGGVDGEIDGVDSGGFDGVGRGGIDGVGLATP